MASISVWPNRDPAVWASRMNAQNFETILAYNQASYNTGWQVAHNVAQSFNLQVSGINDAMNKIEQQTCEGKIIPEFLYMATLRTPVTRNNFSPGNQPFCAFHPPIDARRIMIRVYTYDPAYPPPPNETPSENEAAYMFFIRESFRVHESRLRLHTAVPDVYAWRNAEPHNNHAGWIIMEFKAGAGMDGILHYGIRPEYHLSEAANLDQLAGVFAGIQKANVDPQWIQGRGHYSGDLGHYFQNRFARALQRSEGDQRVNGWRGSDLRERIERFIATGVEAVTSASRFGGPVVVKGNLRACHIIGGPPTHQISGIVGFASCSISHPAVEYFNLFDDIYGCSATSLNIAELAAGGPLPGVQDNPAMIRAKILFDLLKQRGVLTATEITGLQSLVDISTLCDLVSAKPMWHWGPTAPSGESDPVEVPLETTTQQLSLYLQRFGY